MVPATTVAMLAGIFVAGATSGATGLAFPLIAGPVLLLSYSPANAVALTAMCSLTGQLVSIALLRRSIVYRFRPAMILPGLLGVPIGSDLLMHADPMLVRLSLGYVIVVAGVWGLMQPGMGKQPPIGDGGEPWVGVIGGVSAGLVGVSGVGPAIWCALRGLNKQQQRALTQPFILTMQAASFTALAAGGALDDSLPHEYLMMLLPLLAGVGSGVLCFQIVSTQVVTRAILLLVTASGLALLIA